MRKLKFPVCSKRRSPRGMGEKTTTSGKGCRAGTVRGLCHPRCPKARHLGQPAWVGELIFRPRYPGQPPNTKQVNAAASYLHDLMQGSVPSSHPAHRFEIAVGYFRGSRRSVNRAMASKRGYNSMLKLRFGGESLGHYIRKVESYE